MGEKPTGATDEGQEHAGGGTGSTGPQPAEGRTTPAHTPTSSSGK